jgi:uncharacterized protein YaiL (DUF2058 family)
MRKVGNSLQEQLLKAGLVDEQRLRQAKTAKRKKHKKSKGSAPDAVQQRVQEAAREKARRDRELERERQEEAVRKAEEHALRQLIHGHRVLRGEGDVAFNFQDGETLKRIYVTADQHRALVRGSLALVRQDTSYELVPAETAERVLARNPSLVLVHNKAEPGNESPAAEEDPYAAYKVPDDLMW